MPETSTTTITTTINGVTSDTYVQTLAESGDRLERASPSVPAAKVGELTTRTDNDTSTLTMVAGHGFSTSDKVDLFWPGGSRRNMTATVTVNSVVVDGGSGDNLPVLHTAVTAMKPTVVDFDTVGDDAVLIAVKSTQGGYVVFVSVDAEDTETDSLVYNLDGNEGQTWAEGNGIANPLAELNITKVKFSHGHSAAVTMKASVISS